jgi:hypothetical protein
MSISIDLLIFLTVLFLRLLIPLAIPKFPLPAILTALVLDGVDQTIFQKYTDLNLDGYQGYDKALDVYYLTIAYLSTLRNWVNIHAFDISRFLLYYRLVGVMLFEFLHIRAILLVFPNTFEYFFIFYEAVRTRWNPVRMARNVVLGAAAFIWIVIKLPQEYWIHIAQRDVTETLAANPVLIPILVVAILLLLFATWWIVTHRLPPADHRLRLVANDPFGDAQFAALRTTQSSRRLLDSGVLEKVAMVSLVTVIFSQILPNMVATPLQLTIGVSFLIVANSAVSEWLVRKGFGWSTAVREFLAIGAINVGVLVAARLVLPSQGGSIHVGNTLFFLLLITLLVTLYDRYRPVHLARFASDIADRNPDELRNHSSPTV